MQFNAKSCTLSLTLAAFIYYVPAVNAEQPAGEPRVFVLVPKLLALSKQRIVAGDSAMTEALHSIVKEADKLVSRKAVFSVMDKKETPPSNDKHDYMSLATYAWPDPGKPDGKPWVIRDGETSPLRKTYGDDGTMGRLISQVSTLGNAYYFTGKEAYAQHAVLLLKTWFLNDSTRMNPNLNFAQAVPGKHTGSGTGIIDTHSMIRLVDAVGLIGSSPAWTAEDQKALQKWFSDYVDWLQTSKNGKKEADATNNHSVAYDVQVACYALYAGRTDVAKKVLQQATARRIDKQIEPDGSQPRELARTKAWTYSCFNMTHWCSLARLGEHVGVDLWKYQSADGRSIRKALDFLVPYATGEKQWTWKQLNGFDPRALSPILRQAAIRYPDGNYAQVMSKIDTAGRPDAHGLLFYPLENVK